MERGMTEKQIEAIMASDTATLALLGALVGFLERIGAMQRADLTAYLHEAIAKWEQEGMDPMTLDMIRKKAGSLAQPDGGPTLQ